MRYDIEMVETIYTFLLGASFMFSLTVAWIFYRNRNDILSRLVIALMLVVAAGFVKDLFSEGDSMLSIAVDIVAIPLYAAILFELCKPDRLKMSAVLIFEAPFVLLPLLLAFTDTALFYYVDMGLGIVFGLAMFIWTCFAIPRYNEQLKASFSYDEDINLRWLQSILWSFFVLLSIWGLSSIVYNPWLDIAYMCSTLIMWCVVCWCLFKHKSVVDELKPQKVTVSVDSTRSELFDRIRHLIVDERMYLNPMLKLSDIVRAANTNRSYASTFFRAEGTTFFDYINRLRIDYAKLLLSEQSRRVEDIAFESGFNTRQSFHRVFLAFEGMSPTDFRAKAQLIDS